MQFDTLDIPDELIAAQERGELVIFAGAGVSMGGNSHLPSFGELAQEIGKKIGETSGGRSDYDVLLGEWESNKKPVREKLREIINDASSRPSEIHKTILRLFGGPAGIHLVTTNFDKHFSTVAEQLWPGKVRDYYAPALPRGDDFAGIVYLHGAIDDSLNRLVIMDADFGRAYMTQGWARDFLVTLYAKYSVLFIGYSHKDALLTYLARGLFSDDKSKKHFALVLKDGDDADKWGRLKIQSIPYQAEEGSQKHANLNNGLKEWCQFSNESPYDVKGHIEKIVDKYSGDTTSAISDDGLQTCGMLRVSKLDTDYLQHYLVRDTNWQWFTSKAKGLGWVDWADKAGILPSLLRDDRGKSENRGLSYDLFSWAVPIIIQSADRKVLDVFDSLGGKFGSWAWEMCVYSISDREADAFWKSKYLSFWLSHIVQDWPQLVPNYRYHSAAKLVGELINHNYLPQALRLFGKMLDVQIVTQKQLNIDWSESSEPVISPNADGENIFEAWKSVKSVRKKGFRKDIFLILVSHIKDAQNVAFGQMWSDPVAGTRLVLDAKRDSVISRNPTEPLCDLLVDFIKSECENGDLITSDQVLEWLVSASALWQRFGLLALKESKIIQGDQKAKILIDLRLLYPAIWDGIQYSGGWHDPEYCISAFYDDLDAQSKQRIVDAICAGPQYPKRENETEAECQVLSDRKRNRFIQRLAAKHPDDAILSNARTTLGIPEIQESDIHDDICVSKQINPVDYSPVSACDFIKMSPTEVLDYAIKLASVPAKTFEEGEARNGFFFLISDSCRKDAGYAGALVEEITLRNSDKDKAVCRSIIGQQNIHAFSNELRRNILIEQISTLDSSWWEIKDWSNWAEFLLHEWKEKEAEAIPQDELDALVNWSIKAWDATGKLRLQEEDAKLGSDALSDSMISPEGKIVPFWLRYVELCRNKDRNLPYEWPDLLKLHANTIVDTADKRSYRALVIIGMYLNFTRYAFPAWTKEKIYPLMDVSLYPEASKILWESMLLYNRNYTFGLIEELKQQVIAASVKLKPSDDASWREEVQNRFLSHVAAIACSQVHYPDTAEWLFKILNNVPENLRAHWTYEVYRLTKKSPAEMRTAVWNDWAQSYWQGRIDGKIGLITDAEAEHFFSWPAAFCESCEAAMRLLDQMSNQSIKCMDFHLLKDLEKNGMFTSHPKFISAYIRWAFEHVHFEYLYDMGELLPRLVINGETVEDYKSTLVEKTILNKVKDGSDFMKRVKEFPAT